MGDMHEQAITFTWSARCSCASRASVQPSPSCAACCPSGSDVPYLLYMLVARVLTHTGGLDSHLSRESTLWEIISIGLTYHPSASHAWLFVNLSAVPASIPLRSCSSLLLQPLHPGGKGRLLLLHLPHVLCEPPNTGSQAAEVQSTCHALQPVSSSRCHSLQRLDTRLQHVPRHVLTQICYCCPCARYHAPMRQHNKAFVCCVVIAQKGTRRLGIWPRSVSLAKLVALDSSPLSAAECVAAAAMQAFIACLHALLSSHVYTRKRGVIDVAVPEPAQKKV
jgi:hypothetical protein